MSRSPVDPELPSYTDRPLQVPIECIYHLKNKKGKPWVTLNIHNRANSPTALPMFHEGEDVTGSVEVNLLKKDTILSVTVSIKGRMVTGASPEEAFTFFDRHVTLWSKSDGRALSTSPGGTQPSSYLYGKYVWPFSIQPPREVSLPTSLTSQGSLQDFPLPQTFVERNIRASIQYDLSVHISRGKFRMDSHLSTAYLYASKTRPEPLSLLRQRAYTDDATFPGPEIDPEGWKVFDPVVIQGTVFHTRSIAAICTLSLATPLCYTKGSVIPCIIDIKCQDGQALNLLSSPKSIVVRLQRRVSFFIAVTTASNPQEVGWNNVLEDIGSAVWWSPADGSTIDPHTRRLEGEIVLPSDLKPSSSISRFSVAYLIAMFPFETPAFTTTDTQSVLVQPVDIVTMYAAGPRPKPFTPPSYYNTSPLSKRMSEFHATPQLTF